MSLAEPSSPWPRRSIAWWSIVMLATAYAISILDRIALGFMVGPVKADLHISDTQIGLLQGAGFAIFFAIMGFPMGVLADRMNRKLLIAAGMTVWSLATLSCGLATSFAGLMLARIMVGAGEAVLTPAGTSLIGDNFDPPSRPRAFSYYSLGSSIGTGSAFLVIGGALAWVTHLSQGNGLFGLHLRSWQWVFLLLGLPGLVSAALFLFTVKEPARRELGSDDPRLPTAGFFRHLKRHAGAYAALYGTGMASAVATYSIIGWFPTAVVRAYHVSAAQTAGVMGIVGTPCGLISSLAGGWVIERFYRRKRDDGPIILAASSMILVGLGAILAALSPSFGIAMGAYVMMGLAVNIPIVSIMTGVNRITPNQMRGQALAVFSILTSLVSQTIGPLVIGLLSDHVFKGDRGAGHSMGLVIATACGLGLLGIMTFRASFLRADRLMAR
jgi:MFS family permease